MQVQGSMKLGRLAKEMAASVNVKRRAKGLLPRAVTLFFIFFHFYYNLALDGCIL